MKWQGEKEIMENLLIYREKKERNNITWEISYRKIQKKYIQYHFRFLSNRLMSPHSHNSPQSQTSQLNHLRMYMYTSSLYKRKKRRKTMKEKRKILKHFVFFLQFLNNISSTMYSPCTQSYTNTFLYTHITSVGVDLVRFLSLVPVDFPYTSISGPLRLRMFQT